MSGSTPNGMVAQIGRTHCSKASGIFTTHNSAFANDSKLRLYCYADTPAASFAERVGIPFTLLDDHEHEYMVECFDRIRLTTN